MKYDKLYFRKITCLIACVLISIGAWSQKVKKEDFGIFNFDKPRMSQKLDGLLTYHVTAEITGDRSYRRRIFEDQIDITPFVKADANSDADFTIIIKEIPIYFSQPEKVTTSRKIDNVSVNYYYYKGDYRAKANVKVQTKDGQVVYNETLEMIEFVKGSQRKSSMDARDDYTERKENWREESTEKMVDRIGSDLKSEYTNESKSLTFYVVNVSGKKANYDDYNSALEEQKQVFMDYKTNNGVTDGMAEVLELNKAKWSEILKESDLENKKSRINKKVTAAVKYHLGFTHYLLGEYLESNAMYRQSSKLDKFIVPNAPTWLKMIDDTQFRYGNWENEKD